MKRPILRVTCVEEGLELQDSIIDFKRVFRAAQNWLSGIKDANVCGSALVCYLDRRRRP